MFRIEIDDLRAKIAKAQSDGMMPLAAIGVAGTTEEGAVDPIHRIQALRDEFEQRMARASGSMLTPPGAVICALSSSPRMQSPKRWAILYPAS